MVHEYTTRDDDDGEDGDGEDGDGEDGYVSFPPEGLGVSGCSALRLEGCSALLSALVTELFHELRKSSKLRPLKGAARKKTVNS